jgi:hypothetical protein
MFSPSWSRSYSLVFNFFLHVQNRTQYLHKSHISWETSCDTKNYVFVYNVSDVQLHNTVLGNIKVLLIHATNTCKMNRTSSPKDHRRRL